MGFRRLVRVLLVAVVVLAVVFCAWEFLSPPPLDYHTINIDTQTMTMELSDPFPGRGDWPQAEHYIYWHGGFQTSIHHYDGTKHLPYRVSYGTLSSIDRESRLSYRTKYQELSSGAYGTVYAETQYGYGDPKGSSFSVFLYSNTVEHEPVQVVDDLPMPRPPLSAISLIRVFRCRPGYAVVTARYDANGEFRAAAIFGSSGGDWLHHNDAHLDEEERELDAKGGAQKIYGIPLQFPTAQYLDRPDWEWKDVGKPNPVNIINLHYDHNRWVRQDVFDEAGKRTTRYLTYVVTQEDRILEKIDRELPFGTTKAR